MDIMIRKLLGLIAATTLVLAVTSTASAGIFDAQNSFLCIKIGNIPLIQVPATGTGSITLSDDGFGGHQIDATPSVFQTTNYWVNSAAFTGFPGLTGLKISLHAGSGQFNEGFTVANSVGPGNFSGIGGYAGTTGTTLLVAGGFTFNIPFDVVGSGGTIVVPVLANSVVLTGEPFASGSVQITGISTNFLFVPSLGKSGVAFTLNLTTVQLLGAIEITVGGVNVELNTVTVIGSNGLASASEAGTLTLVSPFRLNTGTLAGRVPGAVYLKYTFVPEPGTMLLLLSGAAGLAVIGRKRMRK
jgi:hypothetical protein